MKRVFGEICDQDLNAAGGGEFGNAAAADGGAGELDRMVEIWLDEQGQSKDDNFSLSNLADLPPCMSSSTSSATADATAAELSGSGGGGYISSASSAVAGENRAIPASDDDDFNIEDCINVMENLEELDLLDIWDDNPPPPPPPENSTGKQPQTDNNNNVVEIEDDNDNDDVIDGGLSFLQGNSELSAIFYDWLEQNKEYISIDDIKNIKLKRSIIENASKRLGNSKEAKELLLKLILEWVKNHQLEKLLKQHQFQQHSFNSSVPLPPPPVYPSPVPEGPTPALWAPPPYFAPPLLPAQPPMNHIFRPSSPAPLFFGSNPLFNYPCYQGHQQMFFGNVNNNSYVNVNVNYNSASSSAVTKEARKKRMARHRRSPGLAHRRRQNRAPPPIKNDTINPLFDDSLIYWPPPETAAIPAPAPPTEAAPVAAQPLPEISQCHHNPGSIQQPEGLMMRPAERTLKFLLQKVLKQSDVGTLGRIVLPKKESESYLPHLETREGISIAMEDFDTSLVWNFKYRFWPNNRSRMYLLENTGDYVRANGLQEGDFIVIYADTVSRRYLIRGVQLGESVRNALGKNATKKNQCTSSTADGTSSPQPAISLQPNGVAFNCDDIYSDYVQTID